MQRANRLESKSSQFAFTLIADTSEEFDDFGPYVASIDTHGVVAFFASLEEGGSGIFKGDGNAKSSSFSYSTVALSDGNPFTGFCSHPDINDRGDLCFFAELKAESESADPESSPNEGVVAQTESGLVTIVDTTSTVIVNSDDRLIKIGPLGPAMNQSGMIVFRGRLQSGAEGVFSTQGDKPGHLKLIASTASGFSAFQGIPIANENGSVTFRADLNGYGEAILVGKGDELATIIDTRHPASVVGMIGSFPVSNNKGKVVFCATLKEGRAGVFQAADGKLVKLVDSTRDFESFRGVLIDDSENIFFYATPRNGKLGIYAYLNGSAEKIIAFGDSFANSKLKEFALNPVSINSSGQLAIRMKLENGRQLIVRCDHAG